MNSIELTASGRSDIENEAYQALEQDNKCKDGALCSNAESAEESNDVFIRTEDDASVDADSYQTLDESNRCEGSGTKCNNAGLNSVQIEASDQSQVESDVRQLADQDNRCEDGADCFNEVDNLIFLTGSR